MDQSMGLGPGRGNHEGSNVYRHPNLQQTPPSLNVYGLPASSPYAPNLQGFTPGFNLSPDGLAHAFPGRLSPSSLPHTPGFPTPDGFFRDREQLAQLQAFGHMGNSANAGQQSPSGNPAFYTNPGPLTPPFGRQGSASYSQVHPHIEAEARRLQAGSIPSETVGSMHPGVAGGPSQKAPSRSPGSARPSPDPTMQQSPPSNDLAENGKDDDEEESDGTEDDFYYKKEQGGVTEVAQVGEDQAELPIELFDLEDLNQVLSIQTWNQYLNDEERLHLLKFLPQLPDVHLQDTLDKLLKGSNFNFGSPMQELWERLQGGECCPRVARYAEGLLYLQKKEHTHRLREYHNGMVNSLVQMRSLWEQYPAELPERLAMWQRYSRNEPINKTAPLKLPPTPPEPPKPAADGPTKTGIVATDENGTQAEGQKKKKGKKAEGALERKASLGGGKVSPEKEGGKGSPEKKPPKAKKGGEETAGKEGGDAGKKAKRKAAPVEEPATAVKKPKLDLEKDPEAEPQVETSSVASFQPLKVLAAVRGALLESAVPALSTPQVETAVRQHPGDPAVLAADPPGFTEIVRAALRALSTKPVNLGTKKALAKFDRESKTWTWTGPRPLSEEDLTAAETAAGVWRIDAEFQNQVVENFVTRLRQPKKEPLSEPSPPVETAEMDPGAAPSEPEKAEGLPEPVKVEEEGGEKKPVKRRVKKEEVPESKEKGGASKAASVPPAVKSTPQQLETFQKEEWARYMAPEKAFRYTAVDGGLSMVAGIRGAGKGKSKGKAREHFMLKSDRPPEVTILCLVRDAAARFYEGVGTRADVCSLIRESRYINEDVPENQLNNIVSGAMDRLHYEADPCIKFDSERKVWIYLHRGRSEGDFHEEGTKNTRKWASKRKKPGDDQDGDEDGPGEGDPADEVEEKPKPRKRVKKESTLGERSDPPKEKKKRVSKAQQKAGEEPGVGVTSAKAESSDSEDQVLAAGLGQRARPLSEKPAARADSEVDGPPIVYTSGYPGGEGYQGTVLIQPGVYGDGRVPLDYPGDQQKPLIALQEAPVGEEESDDEDEDDEEETDDEEES